MASAGGSPSVGRPRVTKAVIPAAGLGTRFLPATKATPKEMLPVVDKPAIQYVVEEAVRAGLTDVLMVTGRGKRPLEDHFDRMPELEETLRAKGDLAKLEAVRAASELAIVHFVRQGDPLGLGHAVLAAAQHVGDETFAVLLGDDLVDERDDLLGPMLAAHAQYGGSVIALMEVAASQISLYGCAAVAPADGAESEDLVRITDLIEKPTAEEAPSNLAVIGRYVLTPAIFEVLRVTPPGRGGEIQITDALRVLATGSQPADEPVHGLIFRGRRYDTGDRIDYLKAVVQLACDRPDLGPELLSWLRGFVASRDGS